MNPSISKGASALILASLIACAPEGEERMVEENAGDRACAAAETALADGIQGGDELILGFECLNQNGDFDVMAPVVYAMDAETAPDGTPLLDLWVSAINQSLTNAEGGSITIALNPDDIASAVEGLLGFVESDAPDVALSLVAEAIDSGTVAANLELVSNITAAMADLQGQGAGQDLNAYLASLQNLICTDYQEGAACRSNLTRALSGMSQIEGSEPTPYDPDDPSNDDLRETIAWLLYASGDLNRAEAANANLAKTLAGLAQPVDSLRYGSRPSVLSYTMGELLPALYGDDPTTPDIIEGYPSRNPAQSALYGLLLKLTDEDVLTALSQATPETRALVEQYYEITPGVNGYGTNHKNEACLLPTDRPETYGIANTGLEQVVRILVATNIEYDAPSTPDACSGVFNIAIPLVMPFIELSGTTSIGALVLEIFTQVPLPLVQLGTTIFNNEFVVEISNNLCGMNVVPDDTEALEAMVYSEQTMAMSLPLLGAINHAGKIPEVVQLLDDVWNTPTLCQMGPTLRLAFDEDAPNAGGVSEVPEPSPYFPNPSAAPGSTPHDLVTEPLLGAVIDMALRSDTLLPPIEAGLRQSEDALYETFMGIGRMANNPDSALSDIGLLLSEAGQISSGEASGSTVDLSPVAGALSDTDLTYVLLLTLGSEGVRDAIVNGSPEVPESILDRTSTLIKNGSLPAYLVVLEALLLDLQSASEAVAAGE